MTKQRDYWQECVAIAAEELAEFNADEWGWDLANNCAKAEEPSAKGGK